ncbi:TPA: LysM domain-containing protein, partial [Candidatus Poribacteria bacterium]|nr:LysM domain-containing protein [Candidatus Poribacteria bacterium]
MKRRILAVSLLFLFLPAFSLPRIVKREGVDIPTKVVIIKEGDTLRKLAEEYLGSRDRWREFLKVNIISNPELIMPGEKLYVPILPRKTPVSKDHPAMLILQPTEDDTPEIDVNPVMTEHLIVVRAIDSKGNPVPNVRVEWVLSDFPGSTGDIVEADDGGKINNRYAVTYTNPSPLELKRNPKDGKGLKLKPGDTWVGISATYPGQTRVTIICPSIPMNLQRVVYVTCRWLDIAWEFPPDSTKTVNFSDSVQNTVKLRTKVFKATDNSPIEGAEVSYSILKIEGLIEALFENGEREMILQTDANGIAEAALKLTEPGMGRVIVRAELFDPSGQVIGEGEVSAEWRAPQLKISIRGPTRANMMEEIKLQVELSNSGTSPARKVHLDLASEGFKLVEPVPEIGEIAPGEKVKASIKVLPLRAGTQRCAVSATEAEGIQSIGEVSMEVIPPRLKLSVNGPEMTTPGSQVTYTLTLSNEGDRPVDGVELKAHIPTD